MQTPSAEILEILIGNDILEEQDGHLFLSREFTEQVENQNAVNKQGSRGFGSPVFETYYTVLTDILDDSLANDIEQLLPALASIQYTPEKIDGVPDPFLPIQGKFLKPSINISPASVVYVWKRDCEPCEKVRKLLEKRFNNAPDAIALFGVYGPHNAEQLYDEFQVKGAPTTLFVKNSQVDSRLTGSYNSSTLNHEVTMLLDNP